MEKPIELRTERLLLRPWRLDDTDDLFEFANSPGWDRYEDNSCRTRQDAEKYITMHLDMAYREKKGILASFAIVLDDKVIGDFDLCQPKQGDKENERAAIGYSMSSYHWNKGLTTEAARAVVDWAFQTYKLNRIYAECDPRNIGSWRVMEKLGMKREGLFRRHDKAWNGEFHDLLYYGILREEWERSQARTNQQLTDDITPS